VQKRVGLRSEQKIAGTQGWYIAKGPQLKLTEKLNGIEAGWQNGNSCHVGTYKNV
jgi:hypothetical protein